MRIRNKWRSAKPRELQDNATAGAYIIWQIALHFAKNLHREEFDYESDQQRIRVIAEYLIFLSHITDRLAYQRLDDHQRQVYISTVVEQVARQYQRNVEQIMGSGDYRSGFLGAINSRFDEYARGTFDGDEPGYAARRLLGNRIQDIMGQCQTNKWVIQQIIDIDSLDATSRLIKGIKPLLDPAPAP